MALNYEPLDVESYEIRILNILPATPDSIVRCKIEKTTLISPTKYAALSYSWGDPNVTTNIYVNGVEVTVRVNLADALQKLCLLGVKRVWADSLCINQADRQEKGLQIRNMKHVYSKADETYSWLGQEDAHGSTLIIPFLKTLLLAQGETILADVLHTHTPRTDYTSSPPSDTPPISMILASTSINQIAPENENCKRCLLEARFRALANFFERPYWKRRWIIQEVTISSRVQIMSGDMRMSLHEMDAAISICQKSCYWHADTDMSYSFINKMMNFRYDYYAERKISLCNAITISRDFLSTDPRDIIFALLGICHDGVELVPIPNYQQPVKATVRDISKALFRKRMYLEIISINQLTYTGTGLASLPSWATNGFTEGLSKHSFAFANKRLASWGDLQMPDTIAESFGVFQAVGVIVGTIIAVTSATDGKGTSEGGLSQSLERIQSLDSSAAPKAYYNSDNEIVAALFSCLTTREKLTMDHRSVGSILPSVVKGSKFLNYVRRHMAWHSFCLYLEGPSVLPWPRAWPLLTKHLLCIQVASCRHGLESSEEKYLEVQALLAGWFEANATFLIQGRSLKEWTKLRRFWQFMPRMLDSLGCLILVFVIVGFVCTFSFLSRHTIRLSLGRLLGIAIGMVFIGVLRFMVFLIYRYKVLELQLEIWVNMADIFQEPKKLVLSDKGFIGMTCCKSQPRDKICFLAGRSSAIVLREVRCRDQVRYTIVGEVYVYLSGPDRKIYNGFMDQQTEGDPSGEISLYRDRSKDDVLAPPWATEGRSRGCVRLEEREKCVKRYHKEGMLQSFELV
ncbi:hypothetical protein V502_01455 [Pseudogymnoascus sp. VKM F-4520 (FW-2644)]|nr:hypothetical protein V502_01455 [Pseudogymnoascus sp. VKM F-4520 (FW-2644)]